MVMFKNKYDEENIEEALDLKVISAINHPYSKEGKPSSQLKILSVLPQGN